jgi:hypothetical protein
MTLTISTFTLTTAEAGKRCADRGGAVIFEELQALYETRGLRPLRTLPNGQQHWSTETVITTIRLAQAEGSLNDRPKVDAALAAWRRKNATTRKAQRQSSDPDLEGE